MSARIISFDTETTGLDFATGDRVIELGAVEILDRNKTGEEFQTYLNPDGKEISEKAHELFHLFLYRRDSNKFEILHLFCFYQVFQLLLTL